MKLRWPWRKRDGGYTTQIVTQLVAQASGTAPATALATVEACAGLYSATFAAAVLDPAIPGFTPQVASDLIRDLIISGESLYRIRMEGDEVYLDRASSWTVEGDHNPESWRFRLSLEGPSGSKIISVPDAGCLHFMYSSNRATPWRGVSPLARCSTTSALLGCLESKLLEETGAPSALLLSVPADGGDGGDEDPNATLKEDIAKAKGDALLVETTSGGWGDGAASSPLSDWKPVRLGPSYPDELRAARSDVEASVLNALQVPVSLLSGATSGTAMRESYRRFVLQICQPLSRRIAAEIHTKFETGLPPHFSFKSLWAADAVGRSFHVTATPLRGAWIYRKQSACPESSWSMGKRLELLDRHCRL